MRTRRALFILQAIALVFTASACVARNSSANEQVNKEQEEIVLLAEYPESGMEEAHTLCLSGEQIHKGNLILVNSKNAYDFDANSDLALERLEDAQTYPFIVESEELCLASELIPSLSDMIRDCDEAMGSEVTSVSSAWRSKEYQQSVWDEYEELYGESYCQKYVAVPGYSEHHTGLAADLGIIYPDGEIGTFSESENAVWMADNSYRYGFIRRYAEDKVSITGISNEAWHFRYVGQPHAYYMYVNNLCLEEYLEKLGNETAPEKPLEIEFNGRTYEVFYTEASEIEEPAGKYTVSGDNVGGYVITVCME
jgi:D-alanyl-D-alanine carboxypeptidase